MILCTYSFLKSRVPHRWSRCGLFSFSTSTDGYQSIGSFHSENVEELIRVPNQQYIPPELPFEDEVQTFTPTTPASSPPPPFANAHLYTSSYQHLDRQQWTFLNHGAFGLAIDVGLQRANSWRTFLETQPLRYFDRHLLNHLTHSARCMADFVGGGSQDDGGLQLREGTAMIANVTSGMNAVIGGHARCNPDSQVFYYDIAYGSNKKMCQTYHGTQNAVSIPFEEEYLPLLQQVQNTPREGNDWNTQAAELFISALDATIHNQVSNGKTKSSLRGSMIILEHITSNTAIHVPIAAIAHHAKEEYGMVVAVDGAHGLLGLDLNMPSILSNEQQNNGHVDIYLTNAHKWFSSPRGAALLFCTNPQLRETILRQPAVVSHGVDDGFLSRFLWDGCRDYAAQLSLPVIADFWNSATVNAHQVREQLQNNLKEGVRILVSHWHPGVCSDGGEDVGASCVEQNSAEAGLTLVPMGIHAAMMALVRLPLAISGGDDDRKTSTDAKRFQDFLYSQNVEVPVKCIRGVLYVRVSCHVYNTAEEFDTLAHVALRYGL
eukprot:scaffold436_cov188-Alexandrium_tamarense.AAC.36